MSLWLRRMVLLAVASALVAINISALLIGWVAAYLVSIGSVSLVATYLFRFVFHRQQLRAACWGVMCAMAWGGINYSIAFLVVRQDVISSVFGLGMGAAFGLIFGLLPASLFSLIPEANTQYLGERNPKRDRTITSIIPYISGQGG